MIYTLIRSKRKTVSISVNKEYEIIVKAPNKLSKKNIEKFLYDNTSWIEKQIQKHKSNKQMAKPLTDDEIVNLKINASEILSQKTKYFSDIMNVKCGNIKITSAKKRWGSCSSDNNICYSYRVMLLEDDCINYVVVHELAHILQKNHSKAFYNEIEKVLPNYREIEKKIKEFKNLDLY